LEREIGGHVCEAWVYGGDLKWTVGRWGKQQAKQHDSDDSVENKLDKTLENMESTENRWHRKRKHGMWKWAWNGSVNMEHGMGRGTESVKCET
jgi:hypothetical protein